MQLYFLLRALFTFYLKPYIIKAQYKLRGIMMSQDTEQVLKEFGNRLHDVRRKKGLTQQEAADMIGLSYTHYSNIEAGKINIKIDTLRKLASCFDVSTDYLLQVNTNHIDGNDYPDSLKNLLSDFSVQEITAIVEAFRGVKASMQGKN